MGFQVSRTNSDISRVLETVVNGDAESSFYGGEEQKEIGNFNANNIEAVSLKNYLPILQHFAMSVLQHNFDIRPELC